MLFIVRNVARILGLLLMGIGLVGFFSNGFVGDMKVSLELNLLHLCVGLLGVASARVYTYAKHWLLLFGFGFVALGLYSIVYANQNASFVSNAFGASIYLLVGVSMIMVPTIFKPKQKDT